MFILTNSYLFKRKLLSCAHPLLFPKSKFTESRNSSSDRSLDNPTKPKCSRPSQERCNTRTSSEGQPRWGHHCWLALSTHLVTSGVRGTAGTPRKDMEQPQEPHVAALSGFQAVPIAHSFIHGFTGHVSRVMLQEQEGRRWSLPSRDPRSSRRQGTRQFLQPRAPLVYRMIRLEFWKHGGKLSTLDPLGDQAR